MERHDSDPAVAATVASGAGSSSDELTTTLTEPGRKIGRFVVLEVLGQGAMGLVVAAYDADLDRKVALKLLRPGAEEAMGTERLLREARAMAKLAHPNVLAVHEVGTVGEQVFLAMEFAAGGTLRAWCAAEPRPWRAVLDRFVAAARGLDAAHQGGLVHRDFKPENVLLTAAGEVRVADFGLVGIRARPVAPSDADGERPADDTPLDVTLTRTGALLGTPAYMAPEQFNRADVGPAADQFALCASLWEALYGTRPFPGRTYWELAAAVVGGNLDEPPADRDVPAWLREVLRRGLRTKPAERWPSVAALVDALERDPVAARRKRMRAIAAAAALAALGGAVVFGLTRGAATAADNRCKNLDARLAGVWDPDRAAAVRTAFLATDKSFAADTADRVTARLDDYTTQWVAARVDTCEATHTRGEQSEALLDLRMACLDQRLGELDALVSLFAREPSPDVLTKAADAAEKLLALSTCDDMEALQAIIPPPSDPVTRARADELRPRLAEAKALEDTGRYADALEIARTVASASELLGYAPLRAEALQRRGSLEDKAGASEAAFATLELALLAAADAHDDKRAAVIWADSLGLLGNKLARPDDAMHMRPGAEAALRRAGNAPQIEAQLSTNLGTLFYTQGKLDDALQQFQQALELYEGVHGPGDRSVVQALSNLGVANQGLGRFDEAIAHLERALVITERINGPDHPQVSLVLINLGSAAMGKGAVDAAEQHFRRALRIREQSLGPEHRDTGAALTNLASVLARQGRYEEAQRLNERALPIFEASVGPDHPRVAQVLTNLANSVRLQNKFAEALPLLKRALAINEKTFGPDHREVGRSLANVAAVLAALGKRSEALALSERSISIAEKALGPEHPDHAIGLNMHADLLLGLGRLEEALTTVERAIRIQASVANDANSLADTRWVLGRTLWGLGQRARALEVLRLARQGFVEAGDGGAQMLAEVDAWLAAHEKKR